MIVKIKFKNGKMESDYIGFPGSTCDQKHQEILSALRAKGLEFTPVNEQRKDQGQTQTEKELA